MRPKVPVPLDEALDAQLEMRGLGKVSYSRPRKNALDILFRSVAGAYWNETAEVELEPDWDADRLDDALYNDAVRLLDRWEIRHEWKRTARK